MRSNSAPRPDQPVVYRLQLQGKLTVDWSNWLSDLVVAVSGEGSEAITTVTGTVRDQAALFGLVSLVRNLGVTLITLERISRPP